MQATVETKPAYIIFQLMPLNAVEPFEVINDSDEEGAWSLIEYGLINEDEDSGFYGEVETQEIDLPPGDWRLLGSPFSLTEEQCEKLVDTIDFGGKTFFYDYIAPGRDFRDIVDSALKTAVPSWDTLLKSNKIYQTNPLGQKPKIKNVYGPESFENSKQIQQWQAAQSRTGNWVVLVKYKSNG